MNDAEPAPRPRRVVENGQPWERPARGPVTLEVSGGDAALAAAVRDHPGARVAFAPAPDSDFARAVGISTAAAGELELPLDAMEVACDGVERTAVNLVVFGVAPDRATWFTPDPGVLVTVDGRVLYDGRATAVVVANGQFLRGLDCVPRGHPGDGRLEVQVYAATRRERSAVRSRLPQGIHLPHPRIHVASGRTVDVRADRKVMAVEVDGVPTTAAARVVVRVLPEAFSLSV